MPCTASNSWSIGLGFTRLAFDFRILCFVCMYVFIYLFINRPDTHSGLVGSFWCTKLLPEGDSDCTEIVQGWLFRHSKFLHASHLFSGCAPKYALSSC